MVIIANLSYIKNRSHDEMIFLTNHKLLFRKSFLKSPVC